MKVIEITRPGGPEVLAIAERSKPVCGPDDVVIRTKAAGVNRPDIQQRRGLYPAPPGASDLPGLDIAGIIDEVGANVTELRKGDQVCALTNGGGYAEYCTVPWQQCMPIPAGFDFVRAAALPEVFFTAWNNIVWLGRIQNDETLLIQGGTSGVGIAATQIAKQLYNARVITTVSTEEKRQVSLSFGADFVVNYKEDWVAAIENHIGRQKLNIVLDSQAGSYTAMQLGLLDFDGRVVLIASHLGETSTVNVRELVRRRLTLTGSTLRPRNAEYKGRLGRELVSRIWPLLEKGTMHMPIHTVFPFEDVQEAHKLMDSGDQIGKVILEL